MDYVHVYLLTVFFPSFADALLHVLVIMIMDASHKCTCIDK